MNRRAPLPGAAELFRRTSNSEHSRAVPPGSARSDAANEENSAGKPATDRRGSPRQKHDAKITVYVSGSELLALEQTRLTLRAEHSLAVDRGRLVREAVAVLLADFDENGAESVLVRRLHRDEGTSGDERDEPDERGGDGGK